MNNNTKLYGSLKPWFGGYKYFGNGGYIIILKMKYNQKAPVQLPEEITKEELDKARNLFDIIEEYQFGGLFV